MNGALTDAMLCAKTGAVSSAMPCAPAAIRHFSKTLTGATLPWI